MVFLEETGLACCPWYSLTVAHVLNRDSLEHHIDNPHKFSMTDGQPCNPNVHGVPNHDEMKPSHYALYRDMICGCGLTSFINIKRFHTLTIISIWVRKMWRITTWVAMRLLSSLRPQLQYNLLSNLGPF